MHMAYLLLHHRRDGTDDTEGRPMQAVRCTELKANVWQSSEAEGGPEFNYLLAELCESLVRANRYWFWASIRFAEQRIDEVLLIFGVKEPCSRLNKYDNEQTS